MYGASLKIFCLCLFAGVLLPVVSAAETDDEIALLREEIEALKADHERRIAELEARLLAAEQREQTTAASAAPDSVTAGNAFNPQISLILNGNYHRDSGNGQGVSLASSAFQPSMPGPTGHDQDHHSTTENGFNLDETELAFSATVDPYFDAGAYLSVTADGGIEVEEAWFLTRMMPSGLKLKGGRFLSDFGYMNRQHPHQWDFVDQNLAYRNLLGDHGLQDIGVQLTWLPATPLYTRIGVELLQGDQERFGAFVSDEEDRLAYGLSAHKTGPRLWTAFAKLAPELGYDHTLQAGISYAHSRQHQEISVSPERTTGLEGDADLWGIDLVYKYDYPALYGYRDVKLQAEYLYSNKDLKETAIVPAAPLGGRQLKTDGYYLQGLYGIAPRWQVGLRYDVLGATNQVRGTLSDDYGASDRWTGVLTWVPSEFSLLRLQYAHADLLVEPGERRSVDSFWLQFLLSLGSHGAHRF